VQVQTSLGEGNFGDGVMDLFSPVKQLRLLAEMSRINLVLSEHIALIIMDKSK
jgi:hypothetical protein